MTNQTARDKTDGADVALAEYMRRTDAGHHVDRVAFIAEHPQCATELREYFDSVDEIERMAGPPLASTVKNAGKSVETQVTSIGDSVSEKSRKTQQTSESDRLPEVFGRYRIERQLGRGAMGAVYLAKDTQLDRRVALKTPTFDTSADAEMVERFYREARSAANLRHAGICPVFDVGEIDGIHYISMAYIEGKPLSGLVNIDKPLPVRTAVSLMRKIALALDHAHEKGVIHRDLKPANIMIDHERQPLIMDFGLARQIGKQDEARLTQDGMILGTPAYMSPEQIEGDLGTGKATDVYSLGVILFELLTGDLPFLGTIAAIIGQKMTQDAPPPSEFRKEVDAELDAICQTMMARQIGDRYASMKDLARALADYLRSGNKATQASAGNRNPASARSQVSQPSPKQTVTADDGLAALLATASKDDFSIVKPRRNEALLTQLLSPWKKLPARKKAIATSVLAGLLLLMSVVVFVQTGKGWVKIEILDPTLTVTIGKETITVENEGKQLHLKLGKHKLFVEYEGLDVTFEDSFEIKKNKVVALRVTRVKGDILVLREGDVLPKQGNLARPMGLGTPTLIWKDLTAFPAATDGFSVGMVNSAIYVNGKHLGGESTLEDLHPKARQRLPNSGKWIFADSFTSPKPKAPKLPSEVLYQFRSPVYGLRMTVVCTNGEKNALGQMQVYADRTLIAERDITTTPATFETRFNGATRLSIRTKGVTLRGGQWIVYRNPEVLVDSTPDTRNDKPGTVLWQDDFETDRLAEYSISADWKVHDGVLRPDDKPDGQERLPLLLPFAMSGDAVAEYTVVPQGKNLRDANFNLGNVWSIYGGNRNRQSWIYRFVTDGKLSSQRTGVVIPSDRPTTVRLSRIGSQVTFSVDGRIISTFESPSLPSDPPVVLGFNVTGPDVAYDNLIVRRPTLLEYRAAGVELPKQWQHLAKELPAKLQDLFKGKVTLRADGMVEIFYDFSTVDQLDDWIIREPQSKWAVEEGWLVCKQVASKGGSDTELFHKARFSGSHREIHYEAQGTRDLDARLFTEFDDWKQGYTICVGSTGLGGDSAGIACYAGSGRVGSGYKVGVEKIGILDPKRSYKITAVADGRQVSINIDGKVVSAGTVSQQYAQTGQMSCLRLLYSPGKFDNVRIVGRLDSAWLREQAAAR